MVAVIYGYTVWLIHRYRDILLGSYLVIQVQRNLVTLLQSYTGMLLYR
jgi:hypothetical protein